MKPKSDIPRDERQYDGEGAKKREYQALLDMNIHEGYHPQTRGLSYTSMGVRLKEAKQLLDVALIAIKTSRRYVMHDLCMYHTNTIINARYRIRAHYDDDTNPDNIINLTCVFKFENMAEVMKFCALGKFNLPVTTDGGEHG